MIKICFLAPSGFGKSTAIELLSKKNNIVNVKIAAPLYEMQDSFYKRLGKEVNGQDGELLQFLGKKVRKENENFLLDVFKDTVEHVDADIISNDDCRPMDYEFLKKMGFVFIKINGYTHGRDDHTAIDKNSSLEWNCEIPFDYEIDNTGSLEKYEKNLEELICKISNKISKCYIFPTVNVCNCNCKFCISKTRDFSGFPNFLSFNDKFKENINILAAKGINKFEITGGGEPLLNKDIQKFIDYIKFKIPDSYIKLYTNGYSKIIPERIDEINVSISSYDDNINRNFMGINTGVSVKDIVDTYSKLKCKKRLSLVVFKGGIDSPKKLDELINKTSYCFDEYVVRTIYNGTPEYESLYTNFDYDSDKVVWERDNTGTASNNLILATDNNFYGDFCLKNRRYLKAYVMLKPDSSTYINEILEIIKNKVDIKKIFIMNKFKEDARKLYCSKTDEYYKLILQHLEFNAHLFGNKGLIIELDSNCNVEDLLNTISRLKSEIRRNFSLSGCMNSYISKDGNLYHLNLMHCPDAYLKFYDNDFDIIYHDMDIKELDSNELHNVLKYKSYSIG